ncbi:MAG: AEC family transporter [Clostridia bacterium]|nr:AEC family transporter [Clostridia bacterium]
MLDNLLTVALQVLVLFILMLVGYILGKGKLLKQDAITGITNVILYVATPAAILQSFTSELRTPEKTKNLFFLFLGAVLIHALAILISKLLIRDKEIDKNRIMRFAVIFSNCGYMSFPLQKAILGDIGVFYGAMFVAVFNIILWSYGAFLMSGDKKSIEPKKVLLNPTVIAVVISVILYAANIKLPSFLSGAVTHLGNLNTPLPMIVIGYNLSTFGLAAVFTDKKVY